MKKRLFCMAFALVLAFSLLVPCAQAVQYVTFDDIPGDWNNYESSVSWMNADYVPTSDYAWVDEGLLDGGQVAPGVFEYIADPAYAYQNPYAVTAYLYIDAPGEILYVSAFEGNWESHEYMFMNCVATDGMYVDIFFPSFDKDGNLLNTDRIYLYEYEVDGVWHYECVTFYFRYDGEETRSFLPIAAEEETEIELPLLPEITTEDIQETVEVVTEDVEITEEVIITEDEEAAIGIIGGADGPTSVIVSGTDSAFGAFFSNVLEGMLNSAGESASGDQAPVYEPEEAAADETAETVETATEEIEADEEITGEDAEPTDEEMGSKIFEFFSGAFGN